MSTSKHLSRISGLIERTNILNFDETAYKNALIQEVDLFIRKTFSGDVAQEYKDSLTGISFYPYYFGMDNTESELKNSWDEGKTKLLTLLQTMKQDLEWSKEDEMIAETKQEVKNPTLDKVFVVHGHDDAMKSEVARVIEKLGLKAVILHEQEDIGQTVIEKFEANASQCNFAVVLLSPDDKGYPAIIGPGGARFRSRQNVILELGYFVGRLGRSKVLPLVKDDPSDKLEIPSDLAGVIYTSFDVSGGWKMDLVRYLKSAGYDVDANSLF